jgi:hypothetical protein
LQAGRATALGIWPAQADIATGYRGDGRDPDNPLPEAWDEGETALKPARSSAFVPSVPVLFG